MEEIRGIVRDVGRLLTSEPKEALRLAEKAVSLAAVSEDRLAMALALRAKGAALVRCDENLAAVESFDAALKLYADAGDVLEAAKTRMNRINAYLILSRFDQALSDAEAVTAIYRDAGVQHSLAKHLINTGHIFFRLDRFEEDLACLDQAEAILKQIGESRELAYVYLNRAVALTALNLTVEAKTLFTAARQLAIENQLPSLAAQADYNICYLHFMRGQYTTALDGLGRVREQMVAFGDRWHCALCDLDRAEIYLQLNMHSDALALASSAKRAFEELAMRNEAGKATVFMAMANFGLANGAAAQSLFDQARRLFAADGNKVWLATIDLYEAALNLSSDQPDKAAALSEKAFEVFAASALHGRALQAVLLSARTDLKLGRVGEALEHVAQAKRIWNEAPTAWLAAELYQVVGDASAANDDPEGAWHAYRRGIEEVEYLRSNIRVDQLRAMFLEDKLKLYESVIAVQLRLSRPLEEVLDTVERAKSRTLLDHISGSVDTVRDPMPARNVGALQRLREELNWFYKRTTLEEEKNSSSSRANLQRLSREVRKREAHLRQLMREATVFPDVAPLRSTRPSSLDEILQVLPDRTAIIEYFTVENKIAAFVATKSGIHVWSSLSSCEQLLRIWRLLSFQLSRMGTGARVSATYFDRQLESTQIHLNKLYSTLIQPLEPRISRCESLVVVPHGFLHHVPLHAAFDGSRYLIDKFTVTYAPSASVFRACMLTEARSTGYPLVVGLADRRAPWIEHEVRQLGNLLPDARVLFGKDATQSNVLSHAASARTFHIASHGRFRSDNALFSSIELSDTRLSLFDIYQLRLSAQFVVLSGCETGLSSVLPGDDLFGLARGFLYAGSPTVMVSLWNVNDRRSSDIMLAFYRNLISGRTKAESLKSAMITVRQEASHPFHWAPFVLVGKPT